MKSYSQMEKIPDPTHYYSSGEREKGSPSRKAERYIYSKLTITNITSILLVREVKSQFPGETFLLFQPHSSLQK